MNREQLLFFGRALKEDISGILEIENEFFGSYIRVFDEEKITTWFEYNPDMFYVIKNKSNIVLAFAILVPVSEELYMKLKTGQVSDILNFDEKDVEEDFLSDYCFIEEVCVSKIKASDYMRIANALVGGIFKELYGKAKYITTSPITEDGRRICEALNFAFVSEEEYEGEKYPVYELTVTEELYIKFTNLIEKTNLIYNFERNRDIITKGVQEFRQQVERICDKYSNKTAITYLRNDGTKDVFSFYEVLKRLITAREQFANAGLRPGDRVAIISPHTSFAVIAGFALAYSNITIVLIDAALPTDEINRLLDFSDVRAIFTVPSKYEVIDSALCDEIPVYDISQNSIEYQMFPNSTKIVSRPVTIDPDTDVISILYSSGTTASVKGVMTKYSSVIKTIPMYHKLYSRLCSKPDGINLLYALPFCHVAGFFCAFQHFLSGCGLGMIEDIDAIKIANAFHSYQPEFFALVPKFYEIMEERIRQTIREKGIVVCKTFGFLKALSHFSYKYLGLNIGKYFFKSIRARVFGKRLIALGSGASIFKKSTMSFFLDLGIGGWANFYALTETYVPAVVTGDFDRYPAGTVGKYTRFDGIDVKISDPDSSGVGEIRIKTFLIMKGYFREPKITAAAFDKDGYFMTGDLGYIDKKGYLYVTGRIKEAIHMQTGKKVAPDDVDSLYGGICPNVALASCGIPCKDGSGYDDIHLFIEKGGLSADGQNEMRKNITNFSAQTSTLYRLSGVHFIDKIPFTSVGKVKRYLLKETAIAERAAERKDIVSHTINGDTKNIVLRVIASHAEGQNVTLESRLKDDLGLDSLTMMTICVDIEGALNIIIDQRMGAVVTVSDIVALIESGNTTSHDTNMTSKISH